MIDDVFNVQRSTLILLREFTMAFRVSVRDIGYKAYEMRQPLLSPLLFTSSVHIDAVHQSGAIDVFTVKSVSSPSGGPGGPGRSDKTWTQSKPAGARLADR
jgi:hypothetical protein